MRFSTDKTKVMAFLCKDPFLYYKIVLDNMNLQQVSHFRYLGCHVTYTEDMEMVNQFIKYRRDKQLRIYGVLVVPIGLYGCESLVFKIFQLRKVDALDIIRFTLGDHIRSEFE